MRPDTKVGRHVTRSRSAAAISSEEYQGVGTTCINKQSYRLSNRSQVDAVKGGSHAVHVRHIDSLVCPLIHPYMLAEGSATCIGDILIVARIVSTFGVEFGLEWKAVDMPRKYPMSSVPALLRWYTQGRRSPTRPRTWG